jgi:hypothetical protein
MFSIFKRFLVLNFLCFFLVSATDHPIYVTVTEIEHNASAKTLEVTCKIFTNDFENVLKNLYPNQKIDIVRPIDKSKMNQWISQYIQRHLNVTVDKKKCSLNFVGYEQVEDCIVSYFQVDGVNAFRSVGVTDNLLYEYKSEQISLIHCLKNGERKSTKLNNPDDYHEFLF